MGEEVDGSLGPEYASTPWCEYVGEGWSLKGPVFVPSLRVEVLFHASLQRVSLLHGRRPCEDAQGRMAWRP